MAPFGITPRAITQGRWHSITAAAATELRAREPEPDRCGSQASTHDFLDDIINQGIGELLVVFGRSDANPDAGLIAVAWAVAPWTWWIWVEVAKKSTESSGSENEFRCPRLLPSDLVAHAIALGLEERSLWGLEGRLIGNCSTISRP